jgi:surface antigen
MLEDLTSNTLGTARGIELNPNPQNFTGTLNPLDPFDCYSFTLSGSSSLSLSLGELSANADVELLNSRGEVLQTSAQLGTEVESLFTTLNEGSYYIKVYSGTEATTGYNLSLYATSNQDITSTQNRDVLTGFANPSFDTGVFTVGSSGQVSIDYLFDGGAYQGELGIFSLEGMEQFETDLNEFIGEAARRALSDSELGHVVISDATEGARFHGSLPWEPDYNSGDYLGVNTFSMRPGDTFGVMLIPNGRVQEVFNNPSLEGATRPLFSLSTANPDDAFHVGQIADVTGDGNTFVMEDLRTDDCSDNDYNDVIFQFRGATGTATKLDEVISSNHNWRTTDLGKELIGYAKSYVTVLEPIASNPSEKYEELGGVNSFLEVSTSREQNLADGSVIQRSENGYIIGKAGYSTAVSSSQSSTNASSPDADGNSSISTAWQLNSPGDFTSGTFHPVDVNLSGLSVGSNDRNDFYSLNLSQAQYVNIKLDGLSANANIQLIKDFNNNGQIDAGEVLESSTKIGNVAESITTRLEAGTYFVQVYSEDNTNTQYNLSVVSRLWNVQPDNGPQPINGFQQVTPKPDSVYFSDVTGDGKEDALVINNWGTTNRSSDGTKFLPNEDWTTDPNFGAKRTYYADVDGDGKADAIVSNEEGVFIRRSDGSKFGADERWTEIGYGGDKGTFFADVTGDGKADAIVVNTINNVGVTVRRSDGTKFLPNELWTEIGYAGKYGIYFADVDGDGKADAIVSNEDGITVRRSDGTKFLPNEKWTEIGYGGDRGLFFADVTGDGKADAIVVNTINNVGVTVRRSDGTKFLPNELWTDIGYAGEKGTFFADVTGDGRADAIVSNESGVTVRRSDGTRFLPNETWTEIGYGGQGGHGSLAKGSGDAVYLIEGNQRRLIPNPETLGALGFNWSAVQVISDADLNDISLGLPLPSGQHGTLLRAIGTPGVYIMENGKRRLIPNPETFNAIGLNWNAINDIPSDDLNKFSEVEPLPSRKNGTLLRARGTAGVYLMESGKRRLIPNPETFNAMGLNGNAINDIAGGDLNNIPEGEPLPSLAANHHILTYQEFASSWRNWPEYTTRNPFPGKGANCTWYAHGRMMQLGYSEYALDSMLGNAGEWDNTAGRGATVTYTPQAPCIAVWEANVGGAGSVGHVAVVERVNSDGSILISESNWPTGTVYRANRLIYPNTSQWPSKFITVPKA